METKQTGIMKFFRSRLKRYNETRTQSADPLNGADMI